MIEIERKFLVSSNAFVNQAFSNKRIVQAYISSNPERTVRIRIKADKGFITIKGKGNDSDKIRYEVKVGNHVYEVDIFSGENEGLVMAEIELQDENETFEKPDWLDEEVTNDERYYNAYLSKKPFTTW